MRTYFKISLACRLTPLSFTFSTVLDPPHPSIHPFIHPSDGSVCLCVLRSPQTPKVLSSLFFPAVFYIFIFVSLYLIAAIPLSISFIPSSSLFPSLHPRFQSYLSLSTSGIQSNSSPCFILRKAPHMDVLSPPFFIFYLSPY